MIRFAPIVGFACTLLTAAGILCGCGDNPAPSNGATLQPQAPRGALLAGPPLAAANAAADPSNETPTAVAPRAADVAEKLERIVKSPGPSRSLGSPDPEKPDHLAVAFNELASFDYDPIAALDQLHSAGKIGPDAPDDAPVCSEQIPAEIRELRGRKVVVRGFMIPLDVKRNEVRSFLLVRNMLVCCFGAAASYNEWVYVKMSAEGAKFTPDVLIDVYGTFDVGEVVEDGMVMSLYRVTATEVAIRGGV